MTEVEILQKEIEKLREQIKILEPALRRIATDYPELSHEKAMWQRDLYVTIARRAHISYTLLVGTQPHKERPLNDDF